ncbi:DUF298-domain-containing protein [Nadsonia fulvescens var. elongata DSM 6958]|uniref:Defective in cullin neddylation protein n=1 Tax=Nadsonia fulvescens var. elongata DSM 6958 TaxID=857566 RepID=A0A1E3PFR0_9ASCO|nr:DUF298-domain-containing protein [Nadsonia fulvescens var. elongata DSM 6958]
MASASQLSAVREVTTITGLSEARATALLTQFNWSLSRAINGYYSGEFRDIRNASNSTSKGSAARKVNTSAIEAIFDNYAEGDAIGVDGTIRYIQDLGLQLEDAAVLALAMVLKSPEMGRFDRREFIDCWQDLTIDSLADMQQQAAAYQKALTSTNPSSDDLALFKSVYQFTFKYNLAPGQRVLPLETAVDYWRLLLGPLAGDHLTAWLDFMTQVYQKSVSKDTWNMFFEFVLYLRQDPLMTEYDPTGAWPSVIDDFVERMKTTDAANTSQ